MTKFVHRIFRSSIAMGAIAFMGGCAATQTAIEHAHLETSTKLSKTLFLDPVPKEQKTIFVSVKNTSDQVIDITPKLIASLQQQGYRVVHQVDGAHYLLQANILKVGKMSLLASQSALGGGYGSVLAGGAVGVGLASMSNDAKTMVAGGLSGGLVSMVADTLVRDVNYTMITDVQISERMSELQSGAKEMRLRASSHRSTNGHFQRYRTRIVSNAERVNLDFKDAVLALETGLVKTLAGIF